MKKQMSQIGIGILLALLSLGFFHRGTYGTIPAKNMSLSEYVCHFLSSEENHALISPPSQINSLFVPAQGRDSKSIFTLVACDKQMTAAVRKRAQTRQTPLIFSVSTLPGTQVEFDPGLFRFQQDGRIWQPSAGSLNHDIFPLGKDGKFGGILRDTDIHQGVILLPDWFDLDRLITIKYLSYTRDIHF